MHTLDFYQSLPTSGFNFIYNGTAEGQPKGFLVFIIIIINFGGVSFLFFYSVILNAISVSKAE